MMVRIAPLDAMKQSSLEEGVALFRAWLLGRAFPGGDWLVSTHTAMFLFLNASTASISRCCAWRMRGRATQMDPTIPSSWRQHRPECPGRGQNRLGCNGPDHVDTRGDGDIDAKSIDASNIMRPN